MAMTAINTVLISQRIAAGTVGPARLPIWKSGALRLENSTWKFRSVNSCGNHSGVLALMAAGVLTAPVIIQYSGKRKRRARIISTTTLKIR